MPTLVGVTGQGEGQRVELSGPLVVGREDADLTVPDDEMSRRHVRLTPRGDVVVVEDLGSTNGTHVDGQRITAPVELRGGETLRIGQSTFRLEPDPMPAIDGTRMSERPDIGATRLGARPDAPPEPDPGATQLRPRPQAQPEPAGGGGATELRPKPQAPPPDRERPAASAPSPPPPPTPAPEPAPVAAASAPLRDQSPPRREAPAQPFGALAPPSKPRRKGRPGAATLQLAPTLLAILIVLATAVALIIYFSLR